MLQNSSTLAPRIDKRLPQLARQSKLLLVTGHRRESFGEGFSNICAALGSIAERDDVEIVYPVHLNPNVRGPVLQTLGGRKNVHLIEPQEYLPFVRLMQRADVILTDSGGVQEEAPALGKPVLVMRDVTERPEAVACGTAVLVGTEPGRIVPAVAALLDSDAARGEFMRRRNPYGDGQAALRIVSTLLGENVAEFAEPETLPAYGAARPAA
jgi:UDP-N-acetylglucosamine 2-epimerase (non-hydrolysing)